MGSTSSTERDTSSVHPATSDAGTVPLRVTDPFKERVGFPAWVHAHICAWVHMYMVHGYMGTHVHGYMGCFCKGLKGLKGLKGFKRLKRPKAHGSRLTAHGSRLTAHMYMYT